MRKTKALVAVGAALMAEANARHWGYDLSKHSGIRSGVMYPTLQRMLNEGWLTDGWEDQAHAGRGKRPPRRYYELTDKGKMELGALLAAARHDVRFARVISGPVVQGGIG